MSKHEVILGQIITSQENKDAIHIAVVPAVAGEELDPGQHVGFMYDDPAKMGSSTEFLGIVDPFLKTSVKKDQKFWLMIYPQTITGLRHEWSHPVFDKAVSHAVVAESIAWLTEYAKDVADMGYEELIELANKAIDSGEYHTLGHDTPSRVWDDAETFWEHFEKVTGRKTPDKGLTFFSCAC